MRIVLDIDVLATAVLVPQSDERRMLVLGTYGASVHYLEVALARERQAMEAAAREIPGARIGGGGRVEQVTAARRRELERRLPSGAPDDIQLVGTERLFHSVKAEIQRRATLNPRLRLSAEVGIDLRVRDAMCDVLDDAPASPRVKQALLGSLARIAPGAAGAGHPVVHAARTGEALVLAAKEQDVARYGRMTAARRFARFIDEQAWQDPEFEFWRVDGKLLNHPDVWGRSAR